MGLYAQTCCPATSSCGACRGGITSLTLKYEGTTRANVIVKDASTIFTDQINPGDLVSISSTLIGRMFSADELNIVVGGRSNAKINITCAEGVFLNSRYGDFTVLAGESSLGGPLCCAPEMLDTTPPVISQCPADIETRVAAGACSAVVTWTEPLATDCNLASLVSSKSSGTSFPTGTTVVTYTATDLAGNSSTCSFNVKVLDATPPVFTSCVNDITVNAGAACVTPVTWGAPSVADNCSIASLTVSHPSGINFPLGTTEVTYTAKDPSGNSAVCKFKVIVKDVTPPVFSSCPADIHVNAAGSCGAVVSWTVPVASDNCNGLSITSSHTPGSVFPVGSTSVIYTAVDASGSKSVCKFNVVVKDVTSPTISACPADIHAVATSGGKTVVTWTAPTVTDNCGVVSFTGSHASGSNFPVGTTEVVYTAKDAAGNFSSCKFTVTVIDNFPHFRKDPLPYTAPLLFLSVKKRQVYATQ